MYACVCAQNPSFTHVVCPQTSKKRACSPSTQLHHDDFPCTSTCEYIPHTPRSKMWSIFILRCCTVTHYYHVHLHTNMWHTSENSALTIYACDAARRPTVVSSAKTPLPASLMSCSQHLWLVHTPDVVWSSSDERACWWAAWCRSSKVFCAVQKLQERCEIQTVIIIRILVLLQMTRADGAIQGKYVDSFALDHQHMAWELFLVPRSFLAQRFVSLPSGMHKHHFDWCQADIARCLFAQDKQCAR